MNRDEQIEFVKCLAHNIRSELMTQIKEGRIPENWDGQELRCLLAERFEASAQMTLIRKQPRAKRAREYRNTKLIKNL